MTSGHMTFYRIVEGNTVLYKASEGPEPFPGNSLLNIIIMYSNTFRCGNITN